jgi:hypothetical protein
MPHYRNETKEAQHVLGEVVEPGDTVEATGKAADSLDANPKFKKVAGKKAPATQSKTKAETPAKSDPSDDPDAVKAAEPKETD